MDSQKMGGRGEGIGKWLKSIARILKSKRGETYEIDTPGKIVGWSFLVPLNLYTATGVTPVPSRLLVIESPDLYYFIHKEQKSGMKIMETPAQVVARRLKGPEK